MGVRGTLAVAAVAAFGLGMPTSVNAAPLKIADVSIALPGTFGLEQAAYVQQGCSGDVRDGVMGAIVDIRKYRGKTLEVRITGADIPVRGGFTLSITGYHECEHLSDFTSHGQATPNVTFKVKPHESYLAMSYDGDGQGLNASIFRL